MPLCIHNKILQQNQSRIVHSKRIHILIFKKSCQISFKIAVPNYSHKSCMKVNVSPTLQTQGYHFKFYQASSHHCIASNLFESSVPWVTRQLYTYISYLICIFPFFIDVRIQLSPFSHHHFPLPYPRLLPTLNPTPPWALSMGPSFMFIYISFPSFPHISLSPPLWLLSVCCQFQCLWLYFA